MRLRNKFSRLIGYFLIFSYFLNVFLFPQSFPVSSIFSYFLNLFSCTINTRPGENLDRKTYRNIRNIRKLKFMKVHFFLQTASPQFPIISDKKRVNSNTGTCRYDISSYLTNWMGAVLLAYNPHLSEQRSNQDGGREPWRWGEPSSLLCIQILASIQR